MKKNSFKVFIFNSFLSSLCLKAMEPAHPQKPIRVRESLNRYTSFPRLDVEILKFQNPNSGQNLTFKDWQEHSDQTFTKDVKVSLRFKDPLTQQNVCTNSIAKLTFSPYEKEVTSYPYNKGLIKRTWGRPYLKNVFADHNKQKLFFHFWQGKTEKTKKILKEILESPEPDINSEPIIIFREREYYKHHMHDFLAEVKLSFFEETETELWERFLASYQENHDRFSKAIDSLYGDSDSWKVSVNQMNIQEQIIGKERIKKSIFDPGYEIVYPKKDWKEDYLLKYILPETFIPTYGFGKHPFEDRRNNFHELIHSSPFSGPDDSLIFLFIYILFDMGLDFNEKFSLEIKEGGLTGRQKSKIIKCC